MHTTPDGVGSGQHSRAIRVTHIITGLEAGGAEGFLARLAPELTGVGCRSEVISLSDDGVHGEMLRSAGVPVHSIGLSGGRSAPASAIGLWRELRSSAPDVVMTWLPHADLIGGTMARLQCIPVVWNLRQSDLGPQWSARHHRLMRINAIASRRVAARIVCVSGRARDAHVRLGYPEERMSVVHNGFDTSLFHPDQGGEALRGELRLPDDAVLVGHVARVDPVKDHLTSLRAFARLAARRPDVHLVMCGTGTDELRGELARWIQDTGVPNRVHPLGRRADLPMVQAALDVAVSSSVSEGLSNALGEAMSCGVPCVSTDAGDVAELIGPSGIVVPVGDAGALAEGIQAVLSDGARLGALARERIEADFSLQQAAERYAAVLREVARGR